ncbi:hypothetical protein ACSQ6I_04400 [Anabaena sp. WFMT]|uniref:hypothetical protein n=1 Tax=Anabaena sp. WFMT TaxID=3449730 RepID=UPI003F28B69E
MQWPDHFPEGCPPETAQPVFGNVYRLVDNNPSTYEDFRSWREQNINQPCPEGITECQACGLSIFTSEQGIRTALNRVPRLRKKKIAAANLTADFGVILNTPARNTGTNHHTWWIPSNQQPWKKFEIISDASPEIK